MTHPSSVALSGLRAGTVTLLFTDIEGSTGLLQQLGDGYSVLLADHHRMVRERFREQGGTEVDAAGDGLFYSFPSARAALEAAVAAQRALIAHRWPEGREVRVRMGIHTGEPVTGEVGFTGIDIHRAARICGASHGGQILVSNTTRGLVGTDLPGGFALADLGEHSLKDITAPERLFQVVAPELPREFPALRTVDARPNNLPRHITTFIGRHEVMADAKRLLASTPLVTLTGPGGIGKTRLALELAEEVLDEYDDGVWLVELGSLTDPAFVVQAVASVLGVVEQPGRSLLSTIVDHSRMRNLLVVLDNCEHVPDACAEAVNALMRGCPRVRIIATSREALAVPGEALFPLPSLSLPGEYDLVSAAEVARFESVRLFLERATALLPSFTITPQNASAIAQICRRLDGVPLALELAAARVRAMSADEIAVRLDDRFRLLTGSSRITVPRHQTLRATVDWSYDLLDDRERATFRRVSAFAGGWSLEAAESVCSAPPVDRDEVADLLYRLVDKSLVVADPTESEGRYRLLETVRQYSRDHLLESGEGPEVLRRHRDWFLGLAEQAAPEFFRGPESVGWLERLAREHDNLRAALQWSEDEPNENRAGLRLAAALWRFWEIRGDLVEGRGWLERLLSATQQDTSKAGADASTGAGILAFMQGDYAAASAFHEQSLALHRRLGDRNGIAFAANNLANAAVLQGDYVRARSLYQQSLLISREMGEPRAVAFGLMNMADVVAREGDAERARALFEESLATFQEYQDRWGEAFALDTYGVIVRRQADYETSRALHEKALAISRELNDERGVARALVHLAEVASGKGESAPAKEYCLQSLAIRSGLRDLPGMAATLEGLAWIVMDDDPLSAARLLGSAAALREKIRALVPPAARADHSLRLATLRSKLDPATYERARDEGRAMSPPEVIATIPP
jgi:predicted ATPase/class 3 adenylate cyclase